MDTSGIESSTQSTKPSELVKLGFEKLKIDDIEEATDAFWRAAAGQLKVLAQQHGVSLCSNKALHEFAYYVRKCVKAEDERLAEKLCRGWNSAKRCETGWCPMLRMDADHAGENIERFVELLQTPEVNSNPAIKKFKPSGY